MFAEIRSTSPKPFVFVLMPFLKEFDDIYKFGIKGAAEDVGAYAERVDEQNYTEGILDRIYNQINKADVIVADMTGQNPNVFYEVGYAHALGKIVLLITKEAEDIPFDLKHRPHIVYGGKIHKLREELGRKLTWAVRESRQRALYNISEPFRLSLNEILVPENSALSDATLIEALVIRESYSIYTHIKANLRNISTEILPATSHVDVFTSPDCHMKLWESADINSLWRNTSSVRRDMKPLVITPAGSSDGLNLMYRLKVAIPPLLPGASEGFGINLVTGSRNLRREELFKLTIDLRSHTHSFPFIVKMMEDPLTSRMKSLHPEY